MGAGNRPRIEGVINIEPRKETPQARYDKAHRIQIALNLNKGTDADILEKLASMPNKQGYIKALIRADMRKAAE